MTAQALWIAVLTVIYILVMFAITSWIGRRWIQDERHFMIGGREFGTLTTVIGNTAILISGGYLPAVVMYGYLFGVGGLWFYAGWGIGALVTLLTWLVFWRLNGAYTPAEWLEARYGRGGRLAGMALLLFASLAIIGWQFVGVGGTYANALNISYESAVITIGFVVVLYMTMSGLWGATITDLVQWGLVVVMAFIVLPIYLISQYGWPTADQLPEGFLSIPFGNSPLLTLTMPSILSFIVLNIFLLQVSVYWTRAVSTRNAKVAKTAWVWTVVLAFVFGIIGATLGIFARMLIGGGLDDPQGALGELLNFVPVPLGAVVMIGILAATMSTVDVYLVGGVNTIIRDVAQYLYNIRSTERLLRIARWATFVFGLVCVGFAVVWPHGLGTLFAFGTALAAPLTIMFLDSWVIKKGNAVGAVSSVAITVILVFYWNVFTDMFSEVDTLYVAPPAALLVFYIASAVTGGYRAPDPVDEDELAPLQVSVLRTLALGYSTLADVTDYLTGVTELASERIDSASVYKSLEALKSGNLVSAESDRFAGQLRYRLTQTGQSMISGDVSPIDTTALEDHGVDAEALYILEAAVANPGRPLVNLVEGSEVSAKSVVSVAQRLVDSGLARPEGIIRYRLRPTDKGRSAVASHGGNTTLNAEEDQ